MPGAVLSAEEPAVNTIGDGHVLLTCLHSCQKNLIILFGNLLIFFTKCQEGRS